MDEETATLVAIAIIRLYKNIIRVVHQVLMGMQEDMVLLSLVVH